MLGSFISLMLTLAEQVRYSTSVPNLSRAQALARLPVDFTYWREVSRGERRNSFDHINKYFATAVPTRMPPPVFTGCCSNARLSTPGGERSSRSLNPAMAGSTIALTWKGCRRRTSYVILWTRQQPRKAGYRNTGIRPGAGVCDWSGAAPGAASSQLYSQPPRWQRGQPEASR